MKINVLTINRMFWLILLTKSLIIGSQPYWWQTGSPKPLFYYADGNQGSAFALNWGTANVNPSGNYYDNYYKLFQYYQTTPIDSGWVSSSYSNNNGNPVIWGSRYPWTNNAYYHATYNIGDWVEWNTVEQIGQVQSAYYNLVNIPYTNLILQVKNTQDFREYLGQPIPTTSSTASLSQTASTPSVSKSSDQISNIRYLYNTIGYLYAGYAARNIGNSATGRDLFLSLTNKNWSTLKSSSGLALTNNINLAYTIWLQDPQKLKNLAACVNGGYGGTDASLRNFGDGYPSNKFDFSSGWKTNLDIVGTYFTQDTSTTNMNAGDQFMTSWVLGFYDDTNKNMIQRLYAAPYGQFFGITYDSLYNSIAYDGGYQGVVYKSGLNNSYVLDMGGITSWYSTMGTTTAFIQPMLDFLESKLFQKAVTSMPQLPTAQANYIMHHLTSAAKRLNQLCSMSLNNYVLTPVMSQKSKAADFGLIVNIQNNTEQTLTMYQVPIAQSASGSSTSVQIATLNPGLNEVDIHLAGLMPSQISGELSGSEMLRIEGTSVQNDSKIHVYVKSGQDLNTYLQTLISKVASYNSQTQSSQKYPPLTLSYNGYDISTLISTLNQDVFLVVETLVSDKTVDLSDGTTYLKLSPYSRLEIINLSNFVSTTNNKPYALNLTLNNPSQYIFYDVSLASTNNASLADNSVPVAIPAPTLPNILYASVESIRSLPKLNIPLMIIPQDILKKIPLLSLYWGMYMSANVVALTDFAYFGTGSFGNTQSYLVNLGYMDPGQVYFPAIDIKGGKPQVVDNYVSVGMIGYDQAYYYDVAQLSFSGTDYKNIQIYVPTSAPQVSQSSDTSFNFGKQYGLPAGKNMLFTVPVDLFKSGITVNFVPTDNSMVGWDCMLQQPISTDQDQKITDILNAEISQKYLTTNQMQATLRGVFGMQRAVMWSEKDNDFARGTIKSVLLDQPSQPIRLPNSLQSQSDKSFGIAYIPITPGMPSTAYVPLKIISKIGNIDKPTTIGNIDKLRYQKLVTYIQNNIKLLTTPQQQSLKNEFNQLLQKLNTGYNNNQLTETIFREIESKANTFANQISN